MSRFAIRSAIVRTPLAIAARASRALLVLACVAVACSRPDRGKDATAKPPGAARTDTGMAAMPGMKGAPTTVTLTADQLRHGGIRWSAAAAGPGLTETTLPGTVVANDDRSAQLGASARGRVVSVHVGPGDRVTDGQLLVRLQSADAAMSQSEVTKATAELAARRAQATYARTARERADRLLALKAIPRQDAERAVADDEMARGAVVQAEAELRRAERAAEQLGASRTVNGEVALTAPLTGVVLRRDAVPGTVVEAGAPLVVVTDPSTLWLRIQAPESFASLFRVGSALRFAVPAYPTRAFAARVETVGAGLDPDTRTLGIRAVIDNRDGTLKPEMLASVAVPAAGGVRGVVLPNDAVQRIDGKSFVFIAAPDASGGARFTQREVTVGGTVNGDVAIVRGLERGDLVVVAGAFAVKAELQKANMSKMVM